MEQNTCNSGSAPLQANVFSSPFREEVNDYFQRNVLWPGMVAHAFSSNIWEAEQRGEFL